MKKLFTVISIFFLIIFSSFAETTTDDYCNMTEQFLNKGNYIKVIDGKKIKYFPRASISRIQIEVDYSIYYIYTTENGIGIYFSTRDVDFEIDEDNNIILISGKND